MIVPQGVPQYPRYRRWPMMWGKPLRISAPGADTCWTFQGPGRVTQLAGVTYLVFVGYHLMVGIVRFSGREHDGWFGEELGYVDAQLGEVMHDLPTYLMEVLL